MAAGMLFTDMNITGSVIIYSLGVIIFNIGFLPYLLFRHWKSLRTLQRVEYLLGILGTMLMLSGILFKSMHWSTAGIQLNLAVFLLIFGFLPLQLHIQWREADTRLQKIYAIIRFAAFFLILSGFIFKAMHWPGGGIGLVTGTLMLPLFLIFYFILRMKNQGKVPFMLGDLLITILAYTIWAFVTSSQISAGAVEGYKLLEDQYIGMNAGIEAANELMYASVDSLTLNQNNSLRASFSELQNNGELCIASIDSIKDGFYRKILAGHYKKEANYTRLNPDLLANFNQVFLYFIEDENGRLIKESIDRYREEALEIAGRHNITSGSIGLGLETSEIVYGNGFTQPWIDYIFGEVPVGSVIVNLSYLKQMVLLTESAVLNGMIEQVDLSEETKLLQELAARESDRTIQLKENEIARIKQQQILQETQLEQSLMATRQNRMMAIFAFAGVALVLVLFSISTRAFFRKQKDNRKLAEQRDEIVNKNDELNQQNEEIAAQRDEIEAQRDMVYKQKEQIEKTHNEISASIDYATRLQDSILPNTGLLRENFSDHLVFFRPKQKVSGDFYWWTEVENQVIITAADCTGHGVPGAFMSMLGVSLLREIVNKEFITQPGIILRRLRKEVIRSLDQKGEIGEQKDGMDMALVTINTDTLACEYAGANNPLYLIREGSLMEFKPDRMPVSYYHQMGRYTTHEIELRGGDQLYLFSDGYADQFGGKERKKFKYSAFKKLLTDIWDRPMQEQKRILSETILEWQGDYEQIDDMVIVGLKI